jgi:indoleamine 2,3-dioxygenase
MLRSLHEYAISADRGFLANPDPIPQLPEAYQAWDSVAANLPKLLAAHALLPQLEALPILDPTPLTGAALQRAMMLLSFFGQAAVWGSGEPHARIPAPVAIPLVAAAACVGRPPIMAYASYNLANWWRIDPRGPIALGNLAVRQSFYGGLDEAWFTLVHVEIEAQAAPALVAIPNAMAAVSEGDAPELVRQLAIITTAVHAMDRTLARMPERCDPYMYYHRVRPYMFGWKNNPALPHGVYYVGVAAFAELPQQYAGETGAQSTIIPALDAALGISHRDDPMRPYLLDMLNYAPPGHRAFVADVGQYSQIRSFVIKERERNPALRETYNQAIQAIEQFRARHLEYAARYIVAPGRKAGDAAEQGTGGTPFMQYLKKHRDETSEHLV